MKLKLIALNLLLIAGVAVVAWQARVRWREARAVRQDNLNVHVKPLAPPPLSPAPKPDAPPATKYAEVATNDLFSKDRNPTVVIEAPTVAPPKPMPPLPIVYGVLGLPSGVKAIMAEKAGAGSKPVHAGDTVGEFKIVALDSRNVTFEWEGKEIAKPIEDLIDRTGHTAPDGNSQAAASAPPQNQPMAPPPPQASTPSNPVLGVDIGTAQRPMRACQPGDTSPAGTVVDGYRKEVASSPFGINCHWVQGQ